MYNAHIQINTGMYIIKKEDNDYYIMKGEDNGTYYNKCLFLYF